MSIFVDETTKVVIQGISPTSQGLYHGLRNKAYGTKVVGGTNPKRGGEEIEGIPVFASVAEAVKETGATASFISVPPRAAADAIIEAAEAGIAFIVCITEGIPAQDEAVAYNRLVQEFPGTRLLGPNCPGIISPGKCNIGITSGDIALAGGPVGIVSRSGTLTYQALHELSQQGIGQTTCVGIGGDPVPGTNFIDCLAAFEADPETKAVMMIGEIGGSEEERAADFIASSVTKPVAAYVAGVTAPPGRKMGHAGAIISGSQGTAQAKMDALRAAGVAGGAEPDGVRREDGRDRAGTGIVLARRTNLWCVALRSSPAARRTTTMPRSLRPTTTRRVCHAAAWWRRRTPWRWARSGSRRRTTKARAGPGRHDRHHNGVPAESLGQ